MAEPHRDPSRFVFILLIATVLFSSPARARELKLSFVGPDEAPVRIEQAEVVLMGWGWTERRNLNVESNLVTLDFDSPETGTQIVDRLDNLERALVIVRAEGMATKVSEPFEWPGSVLGPQETLLDFRNGESIVIALEQDAELTVTLRPAEARVVQFVDETGAPVSGLNVEASMYWGSLNHCGFPQGDRLPGAGLTDSSGRLTLPDGDFTYAFQQQSHYDFQSPEAERPILPLQYLLAGLRASETIIPMRRHVSRSLLLRISEGDQPVAGMLVGADMGCGTCGACSGPLGRSDRQGEVFLEEFFPEEWQTIYVSDEDGNPLWEADPRTLPSSPVEIQLAPTAR